MKKYILLFFIYTSLLGQSSLKTSLVGYWSLNDLTDQLGTTTLTNNNSGVVFTTGKISNGADFENTNPANLYWLYAVSSATLQTGDIDFTICCWVKLESEDGSYPGIVTKNDATTGTRDYGLYYISGVTHRFKFLMGNNVLASTYIEVIANTFGTPTLGVWYFICAWHSKNGNSLKISVNNGVADTIAITGEYTSAATFRIGSLQGNGIYQIDGMIDEVGLWKRLLTTQEKTWLYNSGNGLAYNQFIDPSTGDSHEFKKYQKFKKFKKF